MSDRLGKEVWVKQTHCVTHMYCWSIDVAIKINDDEKCVLKLCVYKITFGISGHNCIPLHIVITYIHMETLD